MQILCASHVITMIVTGSSAEVSSKSIKYLREHAQNAQLINTLRRDKININLKKQYSQITFTL